MKNKQLHKSFRYIVLTLLLLIVTVISGGFTASAFAETSGYSNALTDLQKDGDFDTSKYPDNARNYSIQVIQIAESRGGELFVYTYQPCQKTRYLVATQVNMSLSETVDGTKLYNLTLVSSSGVFCKYKVDGLTVSKDNIRFYNISSIYREWIKGIDKETGNDNIKNAVAFSVGKCYVSETLNGEVIYHCEEKEVLEIKNPYHDFLRYSNGFKFYRSSCDSHYVAFSTDKKIDTLLEADVCYVTQDYVKTNGYESKPFNTSEQTKTVKYSEIASSPADGWFAKKYVWDRIESVQDFIAGENLSPETENIVNSRQWVLRFCETDYIASSGLAYSEQYTKVSEVTILRLEFETAGVTYNLGAVSDKVTGDDKPGNSPSKFDFWEWLQRVWNKLKSIPWWGWLLIVVGVCVAIGLIIALVKFGIKSVFSFIWFVVCLPFRGIKALIQKIRGDE